MRMPDLSFQIEGAEPALYAASPLLNLKLRIGNAGDTAIHNILLQCQVQIEPVQREYLPSEQAQMHDLFGEPSRWRQTLRPLLWANVSIVVPGFESEAVVDVPLPCTFDFAVASTKYFYALADGDVPLTVFFSGTVFHASENGSLQISKILWACEAKYRFPVRTWKSLMNLHYGNTAWLCLRKDIFDRLYRYKVKCGIPTWDQALEAVLNGVEETEKQKVLR
jgi:hypothetical protein